MLNGETFSGKRCYKDRKKYKTPFETKIIKNKRSKKHTKKKKQKVKRENIIKCQNEFCKPNPECGYFSFNTQTNQCFLYRTNIDYEIIEGHYSGPKYCGKLQSSQCVH